MNYRRVAVYVLLSQKAGQFYAGCTQKVIKRLERN